MSVTVSTADIPDAATRAALESLTVQQNTQSAVAFTPDGYLVRTVLKAYHNTTQSLTDSTWTALTFNSEDDLRAFPRVQTPTGMHSKSLRSDRFIVPGPTAVVVRGRVRVSFATGALGARGLRLVKNGTAVQYLAFQPPYANDLTILSAAFDCLCQPQDELQIEAFQSSGGALSVGSATRNIANEITIEVE